MNAKVNKNTISDKKFRELLKLSDVTDPEGGNLVSVYAMDGISRYELLATYDRQKDELLEVELASIYDELIYELTDYQTSVLHNFLLNESEEFSKRDAQYKSPYDYAISSGW